MAKGFKHGAGGVSALNFKIVGGAIQPENPKGNTIWVNTEMEISGWVFSATEPDSPVEGMVWIGLGTASTAPFNALKKNDIQVFPISSKHYVDGAWVDVTASCYQDGNWIVVRAPEMYIVKNGIALYTFSKSSGNTVAQGATYLEIYGSGGGYRSSWVNDIDLTNYSTLTVVGNFSNGTGTGWELCAWENGNNEPLYNNDVASVSLTSKGASLDVSGLSGLYKVGITNVYTNSIQITAMFLE